MGTAAATGAADRTPAAPAEDAAAVAAPVTAPEPVSLADRIFTPEAAASVAAAPRPAPAPPAAVPAPPAALPQPPPLVRDRWLPTGTGMWLHDWNSSQGGDAAEVVARSTRSGFTHLYVQTGSTKKGWIGDEVLSELLPATDGTGIAVIAWDFPKLLDPEDDARRMARAATWRRTGVPGVAAVAPDVETAAEGTRISGDAVTRYYRELRRLLPADVPVLATVPWPSEKRIGRYPYAETAPWADAFLPMAYWYNRSPQTVTETSMAWLARFDRPVMPVGQGYDGRLDAPYLAEDPDPGGSVRAFLGAARAGGARSVSLWSWQTTGGLQWTALHEAAEQFSPRPAQPAPGDPAVEAARRAAPGRKHDPHPAPSGG